MLGRIIFLISFIIAVLLFLSSCSKEETPKPVEKKNYYSLVTAKADSADGLNGEYLRLTSVVNDTVFIYADSSNKEYLLKIGMYGDSIQAAWKGYEYVKRNVFDDFAIYREAEKTADLFNSFLFVGYYLNRPSLYKYDMLENKYYLVWSKWGMKITDLHYKESEVHTFFTTGFQIGVEGGFPYITDVRLYKHNRIDNHTRLLQKFGKGLSVSSTWDTGDNLKIALVVLDSLKTMTVFRKEFEYDSNGGIIAQDESSYDLLSEGIPNKLSPKLNMDSPDGNYSIAFEEEADSVLIYVVENVRGKNHPLGKYEGYVKRIDWNEIRNEAVVAVYNETENSLPQTRILMIDFEHSKISDSLMTRGSGNFLVKGNMIFYDKDFDRNAKIMAYDMDMRTAVDSIMLRGGCGLTNIPKQGSW